jgi:hypothetical protein
LISTVACTPIAEPDVTTLKVKRTTVGDRTRSCYSQIRTHCGNISTPSLSFSKHWLIFILPQTTTSTATEVISAEA